MIPSRRISPITLLVFACLLLPISGCGGKSYSGPKRAAVEGTVTYDGQPVDGGSITFIPSGEGRKSGGPITGGKYKLTEEFGPQLGDHTVQIHWDRPTGKKLKNLDTGEMGDETKNVIPLSYSDKSKQSVNVKSGSNTFDFTIPKE